MKSGDEVTLTTDTLAIISFHHTTQTSRRRNSAMKSCIPILLLIVAVQSEENRCIPVDGKQLDCIQISNCPSALNDLKQGIYPTTCGFIANTPYVCCQKEPRSTISDTKCSEYEDITKNRKVHSIAGGKGVYSHEYPHMAAVGYGPENSKSWQCGGTLISEKMVLTAAHCLNSHDLGPAKWIRLGDLNLAESDDDEFVQSFEVIRTIVHPDYKPPSVYHDIALLELNKTAQFTTHVKPACLYKDRGAIFQLTATGWGLTEFAGDASNQLQKVHLDVFSAESCNNAYKQMVNTRRLKDGINGNTQICAGSNVTIKDTCQGDSGGPLQTWKSSGSLYNLVGITSFGAGCGVITIPGVYTKVSHYVPWIESIVWQ